MQLLRYTTNLFKFTTKIYRTQVFHNLTNKQLATPQLVKAKLIQRIPFHSKVSQISLYHGKRVRHAIKSCFSEKKTKRFKRVHKIKKYMFSEILQKKLFVRMSNKAYRIIKRYGSFDKYILLTKPKNLDSKMGQYYRQLMMRKINDPTYRIPYVIGTGKVQKIKKYQRYYWLKENKRLIVPKQFKKNLMTYQRKFGTSVQQLNNEDYQKYLEVQRLKKVWGKDVDRSHPLLLQIQQKLQYHLSQEQIRIMEEKAQQIKQEYLSHPTKGKQRLQQYEYNQKQYEKQSAKVKEAWIKLLIHGQQDKQEV